MSTGSRPLSPHLQIYRPQLTSVLSILHRLTGVALGLGTLVLAWWLIAAAAGPDAYADVEAMTASWIGRLVLFGWTFALFYHLCNGIRHLYWDIGRGFELDTARNSGYFVFVIAAGLTVFVWVAGYMAMGAFQ